MLPSSRSCLSSTKEDTMTIRVATGDELPRCASFLAKSMYPSNIPGTALVDTSFSVTSYYVFASVNSMLSKLHTSYKECLYVMHINPINDMISSVRNIFPSVVILLFESSFKSILSPSFDS